MRVVLADLAMAARQIADLALGGSVDFYRQVADEVHDPVSQEAVTRWDTGYKVVDLDRFERKRVAGKVLITYRGTDRRIDGADVRLNTDRP